MSSYSGSEGECTERSKIINQIFKSAIFLDLAYTFIFKVQLGGREGGREGVRGRKGSSEDMGEILNQALES